MSARDFALIELDRRHLPGWPWDLVRGGKASSLADPRDRGLAEQLVVGVVKNHLHLRHLIAHYSGRSLKSIDPLAQKILSLAIYQLRFLTRIPPSAAVNEAVEQAKRFGRGKASGFVNAVLRKASTQPPPPAPDPASAPAEYAEQALSHPRDLFERFCRLMSPAEALRLCEHDNAEPPTIVRLFRNATEADLRAPGIALRPHQQPGLFVVDPAPVPVLAEWAERGLAQVQDPTAAQVVPELQIQAGEVLLDRCAGLGTKTLQMRQWLGDEGRILAVDPSPARGKTLRGLLERRGIANVQVRQIAMLAELPPEDPRSFDRILIDVPCSNSGVLARRPEARYAQSPSALASLAKLQDRILEDTAPHLRPGGRMVYSTCSIWPEENQQRIAAFLGRHGDYRLLQERATLPSLNPEPTEYRDGGYLAVLAREA